MKEIINEQSIVELKKRRINIIGSMIISLVVAIGGSVPLFLLASRETKYLFAMLLAFIWTVEASFILYMIVVSLIPLNNYMKVCRASFNGAKFSTKGHVSEVANKVTHYKGVAVREIKVVDLDEENKTYTFYVEQNKGHGIAPDQDYVFVTYQSVITSYDSLQG